MMLKLCLMASHAYPPGPGGIVLHQEQNRIAKVTDMPDVWMMQQKYPDLVLCDNLQDCIPYLSRQGVRPEITRLSTLNLGPHQHEEPWRPMSEFCESNQLTKVDSIGGRPVLKDVQDTNRDSVLFSFGIVEQCTRQEQILQFLMSGSGELEKHGLDLSLLSDLMGLEASIFDIRQPPHSPFIYKSSEFDTPRPLVDFVGDMSRNSKIALHPDGRVFLTDSGTEIRDILSIVAEFYISKNPTMCRKQSMLVPQFSRCDTMEAQAISLRSSLIVKDVATAPVKSIPEKIKLKPSQKKKNGRKGATERDLYKRNYFHACESLLSLMMDKKHHGKTAILSLKKSGPELPELLTQFSVSIAGTGIAVLFSVACKVACARVPFCASRLFSTGIGFGLVWLSWGVNRLRNTIVQMKKNASKVAVKEEEMLAIVDRSLKDVYFRAATIMAIAVLRFA